MRPKPGQRVTAPGDEGPALTGRSGHRGGGGGGRSEGTRDGSASGGGSRQGGLRWQRPLRSWSAGRLATWAEGKRRARRPHPAPSPQLSKLQAPLHPPSAPGVNNFFTPSAPALAPASPRARRAAGTRNPRP